MLRSTLLLLALLAALVALWSWSGARGGKAPAVARQATQVEQAPRAAGPGLLDIEPARAPVVEPAPPAPAPAASPPEEDEPPSLFTPAPPDPIELGPAALDLRLVDAATGEGVASEVELWRIDAPGNDGWTAGDQLQARASVPVEGLLFTRLPEGRYRLVAAAAAWCAPLPELEIAAPRTLLDVPLTLPAAFRVRLTVRDRDGGLVGELRQGPAETAALPVDLWRWERSPRIGWYAIESSSSSSSEGAPWPSLVVGPDGSFDLGLHEHAHRGASGRTLLVLRTADGARIRVPLPACAEGELHWVATVLAPAEALASVRWPAGLEPPKVTTVAEAVPCAGGVPGAGWEEARVWIRAEAPDHAWAEACWTASEGELPRLELPRGP